MFNKACDILKRRICELRLPEEIENSPQVVDIEKNTGHSTTPAIIKKSVWNE